MLKTKWQRLVGGYFEETNNGVCLYCEAVDDYGPRFSYHPGTTIAVTPSWEDFRLFFRRVR